MALVTKLPHNQAPSDSLCLLSLDRPFETPAGTKPPKDDIDDPPLVDIDDPPLVDIDDPPLVDIDDPPLVDIDDPPLLDLSSPPSSSLLAYYVPSAMTVYGPTPSGPFVRLGCTHLTLSHRIFYVGLTTDKGSFNLDAYRWIEVALTCLGSDQIRRTKDEIRDKASGLMERPLFEKASWLASPQHAVFIWMADTPSLF